MFKASELFQITPGFTFCCLIAALIVAVTDQISQTILNPLLIALLLGMLVKNSFPKVRWYRAGIKFSEKYVLEFSVMILGATIFLPDVLGAGLGLFGLILVGIAGSMLIAFILGHLVLKLSSKLALLIGVSNSICGNSAAATLAPIIGASSVELSSVIAISGVLGAAQIILLPLLVPAFGLSDYHYGIVAGMAVYAVAQVYAASATVSATSASVATFVKLIRVVLLVPLILIVELLISLKGSRLAGNSDEETGKSAFRNIHIQHYLPWFVIGFIVLAALRYAGVIDEQIGNDVRDISKYTFLIAMLGIGMRVNIRDIFEVGPKVALVIISVLFFMIVVSMIWGNFLPIS